MKRALFILALLISSCANAPQKEKTPYEDSNTRPLYQAGFDVRIYAQRGVDVKGRAYETIVSVNMDTGEIYESSPLYLDSKGSGIRPLYQAGFDVRIYAHEGVDEGGRMCETIVSVNMDTGELHESSKHRH